MKQITTDKLDKLEQMEWFQCVGVHDPSIPILAPSWTKAISYCSSIRYQNMLNDAANDHHVQILRKSKDRYREWNTIVKSVRPGVLDLVQRKTERVCQEHNLPEIFIDTVSWDILHLAIEAEYSDVQEPDFFDKQYIWYCKGHFPCGWNGKSKIGQIIY